MSLMRSGTGHARVSSSVQLVPALGWADAWPNQLEVILSHGRKIVTRDVSKQHRDTLGWSCVMVSAGVHMSSDLQGSQASQE